MRRLFAVACVALVAGLIGCANTIDAVHVAPPTPTSTTSTTTTFAPPKATWTPPKIDLAQMLRVEAVKQATWIAAANRATFITATARAQRAATATIGAPVRSSSPAASPRDVAVGGSLQPCGGAYPPCYVALRESRGQYGAVNPTGCSGRACYGKWQFDPRTWDNTVRRMGRPKLVGNYLASPLDQDAVAAFLWAGGGGCGNWAAC